jgi:hypothetical protein
MYEDLDAPQSTDWLTLSDSGTGSGSGGPSLSEKKFKCVDANEKNPGYPPRGYMTFCKTSSDEVLCAQRHGYVGAHLPRQRVGWVCSPLQRTMLRVHESM